MVRLEVLPLRQKESKENSPVVEVLTLWARRRITTAGRLINEKHDEGWENPREFGNSSPSPYEQK